MPPPPLYQPSHPLPRPGRSWQNFAWYKEVGRGKRGELKTLDVHRGLFSLPPPPAFPGPPRLGTIGCRLTSISIVRVLHYPHNSRRPEARPWAGGPRPGRRARPAPSCVHRLRPQYSCWRARSSFAASFAQEQSARPTPLQSQPDRRPARVLGEAWRKGSTPGQLPEVVSRTSAPLPRAKVAESPGEALAV